jgi:hypothetical protein
MVKEMKGIARIQHQMGYVSGDSRPEVNFLRLGSPVLTTVCAGAKSSPNLLQTCVPATSCLFSLVAV